MRSLVLEFLGQRRLAERLETQQLALEGTKVVGGLASWKNPNTPYQRAPGHGHRQCPLHEVR